MIKVMIIDKNKSKSLKIAQHISEIYSDLSIIDVTDYDHYHDKLKTEKPQVVVCGLDSKDSINRNVIDSLITKNLEVLIYQNDELFCLQDGKEAKKEGYILKNIKV